MFATCARVAPACVRDSSLANLTVSCLSFCSIDTPGFSGSDRVPLAPFTVTPSAATVVVTPCGTSMIFLATRDMTKSPAMCSGDDAEHFAALAGRARLLVGHHTLGGGDDDGAHATQYLRQLVLAAIDTQARTADALEAVDDRAALEILQADGQRRLAAVVVHAEVRDIALVLQHATNGDLHFRRSHGHLR